MTTNKPKMDGKTATTTTAADVSAAHEPAHSAAQSSSSQDVPQARSNKVGASSELPEPNHDLGSIDFDQNLEAIRSFAEPTTRIFAGPYLNVDDVVDAYFDALKMIIQTPTSDEDAHLRTEAYASQYCIALLERATILLTLYRYQESTLQSVGTRTQSMNI